MLINDGDDDDVSINDGDDDDDVSINDGDDDDDDDDVLINDGDNDGSFLLYGRVTTYFTTDV